MCVRVCVCVNVCVSLQVDAFKALGQEAGTKGWKTEDRPALADIYGTKKGASKEGSERIAA